MGFLVVSIPVMLSGMTKTNEDGIANYDAEIRYLYLKERMSDAEVAAALPIEVTASGIYHYRTKVGIKGHRRGAKSILDPHREEITQLYLEDGLTDGAIAERYGSSAEAVRKARLRWGVATTRNKAIGRYSMEARFEEVRDQLPAAWERSKRWHSRQQRMVGSSARVAQEFGVSPTTAYKWLTRLGLGDPKSAHGEDAPARAVKLFDTGLSVPAVAREMGCPEDTVRSWISRERSLANPGTRRSHEEKLAFRRAISAAKTTSVAGSGRYSYRGHRLDSSFEVRFAANCDRLGLSWRPYDRAQDGVLEVDISGEIVRYAPDFVVGDLTVEVKGIFDILATNKVKTWREERGKLAMIMKQELLDFESARDAQDARNTLLAACYLTPPTDPAYWD